MKTVGIFSLVPVAILAVGSLTAGRAFAAPVLLNGSFESPAVTSLTAGGGDDWTPTGDVFIVPNSAGFGSTPYGTQYLGLDGSSGSTAGSDSQTIAGFAAGATYFLGVDFADLLGGNPSELTITLSGAFSYSQTFSSPVGGPYSGTIPFQSASVFFTPLTSGSITVTLSNPGPGATAVDNVGLYSNVATPPVPEPASVTATLLGAAVLAGAAIRRARRA